MSQPQVDDDPGYATGDKLRPCRCGADASLRETSAGEVAICCADGACKITIYANSNGEARLLWNAAMRPDVPSVVQQPGEWVYPGAKGAVLPTEGSLIEWGYQTDQPAFCRYYTNRGLGLFIHSIYRWRYPVVAHTHPANPAVAELEELVSAAESRANEMARTLHGVRQAVAEAVRRLNEFAERCKRDGEKKVPVDWVVNEVCVIANKLESAGQPVNVEAADETDEIKSDPELMAALQRSEADVAAGRVKDWADVKRDLNLDEPSPSPSLTEAVDAAISEYYTAESECLRESLLKHLAGFSRAEPHDELELVSAEAIRKIADLESKLHNQEPQRSLTERMNEAYPTCPKCGNTLQNATPDGSPNLRRCASCKHVWEPQRPGSGDTGWIDDILTAYVGGSVGLEYLRREIARQCAPSVPLVDDRERIIQAIQNFSGRCYTASLDSEGPELVPDEDGPWVMKSEIIDAIRSLPPAQEGMRSEIITIGLNQLGEPVSANFGDGKVDGDRLVDARLCWRDPTPAAEPPVEAIPDNNLILDLVQVADHLPYGSHDHKLLRDSIERLREKLKERADVE